MTNVCDYCRRLRGAIKASQRTERSLNECHVVANLPSQLDWREIHAARIRRTGLDHYIGVHDWTVPDGRPRATAIDRAEAVAPAAAAVTKLTRRQTDVMPAKTSHLGRFVYAPRRQQRHQPRWIICRLLIYSLWQWE